MTVCMKSTPAERCRFLLIGIGDTASRRRVFDLRFAYGKKLLLMLFSMSRRRFTLFNVVSTPHIDRVNISHRRNSLVSD